MLDVQPGAPSSAAFCDVVLDVQPRAPSVAICDVVLDVQPGAPSVAICDVVLDVQPGLKICIIYYTFFYSIKNLRLYSNCKLLLD